MNNIQKYHDHIFNFLSSWSEIGRTDRETLNPYFYMRSVRDERFRNGYWFPGNDTYICLSFWAGGDSSNKTPNIYFELHEKAGCRVFIISKDSPSKYLYFEKLVEKLNLKSKNPFVKIKNNKGWVKQLTNKMEVWHDYLIPFIQTEKIIIDQFMLENVFNSYDEFVSDFSFISPKNFDAMYSRVLKERESLKEREHKMHLEFLNQPKLPFALLGISIENFQGVKNTKISNLPPDTQWIFITGENGYGKTTLLQAIALGLSGDSNLEMYLESKTRISVDLIKNNEKAFIVRIKGSISMEESYDLGDVVLGYGPSRLNTQSLSSENKEGLDDNNVRSLFDNETLLKNINYELFASEKTDIRAFEALEELIKTVTKGRISEIKIKGREALFVESLSNGDILEPMPLSKLAAGFRSILNIVIDIYLRFKKIHPNLNYTEFFGIVLIDEIENHLHPILQKELPITLSQVFPKVQFIITSHSPIPLLGALKNSVVLKVNRNKEVGVTIERLDEIVDFPNLLPNTLLSSPIFGFESIFPISKDKNSFIRTEDTYAEVKLNDEQSKRIGKYFTEDVANDILELLRK